LKEDSMLRLPISRSGVVLPAWLVSLLAGLLTVMLCFTTDVPSARAETPSPVPSPAETAAAAVEAADSDGDGAADRPDLVSAAVTAQALDASVEDLSQRSGTTRVVVNPDGSITEEAYSAPMWVQDSEGRWVDVDYTLVPRAAGGFAPKAAPTDLVIDGGSREFARLVLPDGTQTIWSWPEVLPTPAVEGPVATYQVGDGAQLVVIATARGVSTRIRIDSASAAAATPLFRVQVRTVGASLEETDDGQLIVTDGGTDDRSGQTAVLTAWDSRVDAFGDPTNVVPIEASVKETGSSGERTDQVLTLRVPAALVDDPEAEYPITIDPDLAPYGPTQDAWAREGVDWVSDLHYRLIVGASEDHVNTNAAVSLVQWDSGKMRDRTISNAQAGFYQYMSASCSSKRVNIYPVTGAWDELNLMWSNKPGVDTAAGTSSYFTANIGATNCTPAGGFVTANVTGLVQAWADGAVGTGGIPNYGMQLSVPDANKNDYSFERRLCSVDYDPTHTTCDRTSRTPYLKFTYTNRAPTTPTTPTVSNSWPFDGRQWTSSTAPTFTSSTMGWWGSTVQFTYEVRTTTSSPTVVGSCTTASVSWTVAQGCAVSGLAVGSTYVVRSKAVDNSGLISLWSAWQPIGVATAAPTTPTLSCTGYTDAQWYATRTDATTSCTFTASGAADFRWWVYQPGGFVEQTAIAASGGTATTPGIDIPAEGGYFIIKAVARNTAGLGSAEKAYSFGIGSPQLTLPNVDDRSTSTFPIQAKASANPVSSETATARVEWRYPPTDANAGDAPPNNWNLATKIKDKSTGQDWTGSVTPDAGALTTPELVWAANEEPGIQIPSLLQVRIVFSYPSEPAPQVSAIYRFQLVPHAFGGSYPTQDVGAGTLALFTGEYQVSETDVSVPGTGGNLTLGRTHGTLTGDPAGPSGVFGPGWTADIAGQGAGVAGYTVIDHTDLDGTIVLTSPEGVSDVYQHEDETRGALKLGSYLGVGETALNMDTLELAAGDVAGITHKLILTEEDGTLTEFQRNTAGVWTVARTTEPEANSTVRFVRNPDGLITWVFAPKPSDTITCDESTQQRGCKALKLNYTTTSGGQRLAGVQYVAWDPKPGSDGLPTGNAGMATVDVAGYSYDTAGRLIGTWTPQSAGDNGTGHTTSYTYTSINSKTVVETITDPGQKTWRFGYSNGALSTVKRQLDPAVGTGDATWTIAYDVPLSGNGLPNLQVTEVAKWGQRATDAPVGATAVFEPDHVPATGPADTDWPYATISYFTQAGRVTNTASYGAGDWQINSTRYDDKGNSTWTLTAAGRAAALAENDPATAADKYATLTVYNTSGTRVEQTYSPMLPVVLANGTTVTGRTLVETVYDDEADASLMPGKPTEDVPTGGYNLAVEQRVSVTDLTGPGANGSTWDTKKTRYRYDPVTTGDASGWTLRVPTRTLTEDGDDWATSISRYDSEGKIVETRTPGGTAITDNSADDPYSTRTIYYTADDSAEAATCRAKPEWAGSVCIVKTAGNPATGHPIPAKTTTGYSLLGDVTRLEETSSAWTRATATAYDYQGRAIGSTLTLTDSDPISGTTNYDPTTGAVTTTTSNGITEDFTYDTWGRLLTATDGTGNTASTTYDTAGRTKTFNDGKGTYTYTYDGTDNQGKTEHRGLTTRIDLGYADGDTDQITGSYDATGNLIRQTLPGGYAQAWTRNLTGQPTNLTYTTDGDTTQVMAFGQTYDHLGRVVTASGPTGTKRYTYDDRARLTRVQDTTADGCTTRRYTFTGDSNRTSLTTYGPGAEGACQTTTAASTTSYDYDQADRIVGDSYTYDPMGRTLTIPKAHTNQAGIIDAGDLTIGYAANDMVTSLQQTIPDTAGTPRVRKQTFTLDGSDRVSTIKDYTDTVQLAETTNHYDGDNDSPAWTETKTRPDGGTAWTTPTWNRYVSDLTGGLAVDVDGDNKAVLQLANLHGDIVATATVGQPGINTYTETDEYGRAQAIGGTSAPRYGWLGTHQRDAGTIGGLVLMGARLYNPETGRFLSIDPVSGGNDNRYTYPADPINKFDLTGESWFDTARLVLSIASIFCTICGAVSLAITVGVLVYHASQGNWGDAASELVGFIPGVGRLAGKVVSAVGSRLVRAGYKGIKAARKGINASVVKARRNVDLGRRLREKGYRFTHRAGRTADILAAAWDTRQYVKGRKWAV